jgi:3-carboxy-cis,cis-muconate cycloisomerase
VVNEKGGTLAQVLAQDPAVSRHFDAAAIAHMTDPANYSGLAAAMVDRVLAAAPRDYGAGKS